MHKLIPHLWFDNEGEEAAEFYTSVFKDAKITGKTHYPEAATEVAKKPVGSVMTVEFEIGGQPFVALNGGPDFKFSEAVSFMVPCDNQDEIDYYWEKLRAGGGEEGPCGWLKDRFGVSWQITPKNLDEMMKDKDQKKVNAVTAAFMQMKKLDIAALERAYAGKAA